MPYVDLNSLHTPTPGDSPPATWGSQVRENDEWFQANRREVCTSSTLPTGFEGLEIYETDTNRMWLHDGSAFKPIGNLSAWNTYTPTLTQSATISKTVTYARYNQIGRQVVAQGSLAATSAGTANNVIKIGLPVTGVQTLVPGGMIWWIASGVYYTACAAMDTTSTIVGVLPTLAVNLGQTATVGGSAYDNQVASGDTLAFSFVYEAAS